jgi:hypothetical protein
MELQLGLLARVVPTLCPDQREALAASIEEHEHARFLLDARCAAGARYRVRP